MRKLQYYAVEFKHFSQLFFTSPFVCSSLRNKRIFWLILPPVQKCPTLRKSVKNAVSWESVLGLLSHSGMEAVWRRTFTFSLLSFCLRKRSASSSRHGNMTETQARRTGVSLPDTDFHDLSFSSFAWIKGKKSRNTYAYY